MKGEMKGVEGEGRGRERRRERGRWDGGERNT